MAEEFDPANLPPITRCLYGIAVGGPDEDDYHQYLLEKYARECANRQRRSSTESAEP